MNTKNAGKIIKQHYGLKREVTEEEVEQEIAVLKRKGFGDMCDTQFRLAMKLGLDRE